MGKAMLVPNVDFSTNRVAIDTIIGQVPCTKIELNKDSLALNEIGNVAMLVARVEPWNTTDPVLWSSSDPGIVSVIGGLVVQKGAGTAVITAECGSETVTCTIVCKVYYDHSDLVTVDGKGLINTNNTDYIHVETNSRYMYVADDTNITGGYMAATDVTPAIYGIAIPHGSTKMIVNLPHETGATNAGDISTLNRTYLNTLVKQTGVADVDAAKVLSGVSWTVGGGTLETGKTVIVIPLTDEQPEAANACVFNVIAKSGSTPADWSGEFSLAFE